MLQDFLSLVWWLWTRATPLQAQINEAVSDLVMLVHPVWPTTGWCVVLEQSMECNLRYHLFDCYTFTLVLSHTCQNNGPFCAGCERNLKEWMESPKSLN